MRYLSLIALLLIGSIAFAQDAPTLASKSDVKTFTDAFLKSMAGGATNDAFKMLETANPADAPDIEIIRDKTSQLLVSLLDTYGKPIGYDIVVSRALGDSVLKYETLVKLEKYAIRCTIVYYKPVDKWIPVRINFDPDLNALFDELNNNNTSARRETDQQP